VHSCANTRSYLHDHYEHCIQASYHDGRGLRIQILSRVLFGYFNAQNLWVVYSTSQKSLPMGVKRWVYYLVYTTDDEVDFLLVHKSWCLQFLLGFGENNKKFMCYATPNIPKDLSISNAVTVGVWTRTLIDRNVGITLSHKHWQDDVADLKVDEDLGATTLVSPEWHLHVLTHIQRPRWLPKSPFQPRCGSRRLWTGIQKLRSTMACSSGDSLLLRSPSGGHMGVREEEEGGGQGCDWRPGGRRRRLGGGARGYVLHLLLQRPPFI
jgi:hypothetical protein